MKITNHIYLVLAIAITLGGAACSFGAPATEQATPSPVPTEVAADPFHPLSTRTGVEEIDRVLEVVESGDRDELVALVEFTEAKCTYAEGLGGPPKCRDGEEEGTSMQVLPFLGGEGSYLRAEEIHDWTGIDVSALYAIYEVNPANIIQEDYFPAGEYAIVLVGAENQSPVALRITDGRIVRVDFLFEPTPEALDPLIEREAAHVVLQPKKP